MSKTLLNEKEVAELIGMSVHWLRRMRWAGGGIPYMRMNPLGKRGAIRYRPEDIESFCTARVRRSTSER